MGVVRALRHVLEPTHGHGRAYFGLLAPVLDWPNHLYVYLLVCQFDCGALMRTLIERVKAQAR